MAEAPRIVFITDLPPPRTGQSLVSESLLGRLRRQGNDVGHLPLTGSPELQPGKLSKLRLFLQNFFHVTRSLRVVSEGEVRTAYFVCPSTTAGALANLLLAMACPSDTRVVMHVHNGDFIRLFQGLRRPVGWLVARVADTVIFPSPGLSARVPLPARKKAHVSNPVAEDFEAALTPKRTVDWNTRSRETLTVGFLSNFLQEKGYEAVARAVLQLRRTGCDVVLNMWGAWPSLDERATFQQLLASDPLWESCVRIHPALENGIEVVDALASIDVMVLPTTYRREAHPLSIIEAFAAGVPVIATRHASIPEMVRDGENGFLLSVPAGPDEIAHKLAELVTADREALSRGARATYEADHRPDHLAKRFAEILCPN